METNKIMQVVRTLRDYGWYEDTLDENGKVVYHINNDGCWFYQTYNSEGHRVTYRDNFGN